MCSSDLLPLSIALLLSAAGIPKVWPKASPRLIVQTGLVLLSERGTALGRVGPDKQVHLVRGDREAFGIHGRSAEQRVALDLLRPLLRSRDPRLGALDAALARLGRTLAVLADPFRLPRARREMLDARLDDAVELLADVAVITDPVLPMPDGDAS